MYDASDEVVEYLIFLKKESVHFHYQKPDCVIMPRITGLKTVYVTGS